MVSPIYTEHEMYLADHIMSGFHKNVRDISIEIHIRITNFRVVYEYFVGGNFGYNYNNKDMQN